MTRRCCVLEQGAVRAMPSDGGMLPSTAVAGGVGWGSTAVGRSDVECRRGSKDFLGLRWWPPTELVLCNSDDGAAGQGCAYLWGGGGGVT